MHSFDKINLQLFARRDGRNYMMRSEKRPSYERPRSGKKRPRRRRTSNGYLLLTLIVSVLLWPIGLFLIWNRRLRYKIGGKLIWTFATLIAFVAIIVGVLTIPSNSPKLQAFQDRTNDAISTLSADSKIAWETFSERSSDAWGNIEYVGVAAKDFALAKTADGTEAGVEIAQNIKNSVADLFVKPDEVDVTVTASPDILKTPASTDSAITDAPSTTSPETKSSPTPGIDRTATPTPTDDSSAKPSSSAEVSGAKSGLALARAAGSSQPTQAATEAPTEEPTPSPTPDSLIAPTATPTVAPTEASTPVVIQAILEPTSEITKPAQTAYPIPTLSSEPTAVATEVPATEAPTEAPTQLPTEATTEAPTQLPTELAPPNPAPASPLDANSTLGISPDTTPTSAIKPAGESMVYHTKNGKWYHAIQDCSGMQGAELYTLESSVADGFKACSKCSAPAAELLNAPYVVWTDIEFTYHVTDECPSFSGDVSIMTLADAVAADYEPCASCGAIAYASEANSASSTTVASTTEPAATPASTAVSTPTEEVTPSPTPYISEEDLLEKAKEITVHYSAGSKGYHKASTCVGMTISKPHTLYEAIEDNKKPCSNCKPPTLDDLR